ncbi:hypothetical protein F0249_12650 [Vibrio sp. 03-59-1]|uniref:hypothetical protein n=1 Tax=Vibrio sp. 03-59-1 TaxID=2607607 RepID=UPI0014939BDA|nr:hypothetical protein [Vibrio sp. 03-59-1]NOH84665.1 hypothetical protein [Vibrio sp. 03-59-1]
MVDSIVHFNIKLVFILLLIFTGTAHASMIDANNPLHNGQATISNIEKSEHSEPKVVHGSSIIENESKQHDLIQTVQIQELKYDNLVSAHKMLQSDYFDLMKKFKILSSDLTTINNQIKESKETKTLEDESMRFEVWIGLLLACVTLIVTGFGVFIALSAFYGYSNIKQAAINGAVMKSESLIENAIQEGHFNVLIYSAVERAVYRDILSEEDFPEDIEDNA